MNPDKGVLVRGMSILSGHKAIRNVYHRKTGDQNVRSRTNHDIFAEPEDYDGRETGRNPANGD
jgi:hypothetical protein